MLARNDLLFNDPFILPALRLLLELIGIKKRE